MPDGTVDLTDRVAALESNQRGIALAIVQLATALGSIKDRLDEHSPLPEGQQTNEMEAQLAQLLEKFAGLAGFAAPKA
jgi:hypothetical protein